MLKDEEHEVHRKGGREAALCHIWQIFRILRCSSAMDEDAAMERNLCFAAAVIKRDSRDSEW